MWRTSAYSVENVCFNVSVDLCRGSKGSFCATLGGDEQVKQNRSEQNLAKLNTIKTCLFFILSSPSLRQAYRFVFVFGLCRALPFFSVFLSSRFYIVCASSPHHFSCKHLCLTRGFVICNVLIEFLHVQASTV